MLSRFIWFTFISTKACETGSFEFKYAREHTEPRNKRTPRISFWLQASQKKEKKKKKKEELYIGNNTIKQNKFNLDVKLNQTF